MANKSNKNSNQSSQKIPVSLASLPAVLLPWYDREKRSLPWRDIVTPYRTWVSEIMLQQTRVQAVLPYFERFMAAAPDVPALAELAEDRLLSLWQGLGYYSRARSLQRSARVMVDQYGGCLPDTYSDLIQLPGIGDYTAGAILSIAFNKAVPAVDGNVLRIAARLTACGDNVLDPRTRQHVRDALAALGATADDAVMIGDRFNDVEGAHAMGVPCIGIYSGAAAPGEHEAAGADAVVHSVAELAKLFAI